MTHKEEEKLKDYVEQFHYNIQRSNHSNLDREISKIILIQGMRDDCLDMLNLLGKGDISKEPFEKIVELCRRYSRGSSRTNK